LHDYKGVINLTHKEHGGSHEPPSENYCDDGRDCRAISVFSLVQAANEWAVEGEKVVRYDAKVVDILYELSVDYPANCGGSKRQLRLLKDDGTLWPVVKNNDLFAGAVDDLIEYCGKKITADGLEIHNAILKILQLQFKRLAPHGKWKRANWFTRNWSKRNGGEDGGVWIWEDKTVQALIAEDGVSNAFPQSRAGRTGTRRLSDESQFRHVPDRSRRQAGHLVPA